MKTNTRNISMNLRNNLEFSKNLPVAIKTNTLVRAISEIGYKRKMIDLS